ncbi:alpha/beta hydrolase [Candidatus Izimaplasma bacterium]|nr:alpha/beta hydrolase [Candidatus Izimaplasma bacterium]
MKKIMKRTVIGILVVILVMIVGLTVYSSTSYEALDEMHDEVSSIESTDVTRTEDNDEITFTVDNPLMQIVFIPGGLVEPDSYEYLAYMLAKNGFNVTIAKAFFNLAILTPNYAKRFLSEELDNVIIGHSLGGVVASMVASNNDLVDQVILLGSYPIRDLTDKEVLIITAEHDLGMDQESFDDSLELVSEDTIVFDIVGGNHAQFGWYGPQKGDGEAEIDTLVQQGIVLQKILEFIE